MMNLIPSHTVPLMPKSSLHGFPANYNQRGRKTMKRPQFKSSSKLSSPPACVQQIQKIDFSFVFPKNVISLFAYGTRHGHGTDFKGRILNPFQRYFLRLLLKRDDRVRASQSVYVCAFRNEIFNTIPLSLVPGRCPDLGKISFHFPNARISA